MGKVLMFLGVIILIASIGGMAYGFVAGPLGITSGIQNTISEDRAAELCNEDEELETSTGAQSYTPGVGYGRNVLYYCVDKEGTRREVTGEFVQNLVGNTMDTVFGSMGTIGIGVLASFGLGIGIILIVVGSLVNRFRRRDDAYMGGAFNMTTGYPQVSVQRMDLNSDFAPFIPGQSNPMGSIGGNPANNANLTERLRQLENARRENLISQAEYDRMRKDILDQMR